ncbi:hypothetical protein [Granulicella arctica]|uniref:Uncharacterized protein n=1 Tax=Granulicella arctica TaxID=940613 RepID=A0A7Y9PFB5_9BACT|nr:hypothetical protein [Granulicella arctica]NYF78629.1 hypothetical protein [Granulicella arctica]
MVFSEQVTVVEANVIKDGDVLITFSNDTIVLYQAEFLYKVRSNVFNVQVVDPFNT